MDESSVPFPAYGEPGWSDCRGLPDLREYRGRWVAVLRGRVVGTGDSACAALEAARSVRDKDDPALIWVPT